LQPVPPIVFAFVFRSTSSENGSTEIQKVVRDVKFSRNFHARAIWLSQSAALI
jgi:hypothetical protein